MPSLPRRCTALLLLPLFLLLAAGSALAMEPRPFDARYRLEVKGWPNATIEHRLSHDGAEWRSEMSADIAVARGSERSRFLAGPAIRSLHYASGYTLMGFGKEYELDRESLDGLPDRQAALFELSRRASAADCAAPCRLRYLDHRGREKEVEYRVLSRTDLSLPAGEFEAVRVEVTEPDEPGRRMIFSFHPELPGLLLAMEYQRDGERRSRLALTELALGPR
ncbi:hypothetical protein BOX17_04165 [Halomonas aestuarii]|uniref:DUF3108 domain-containing protein n=1 Tax=Halomonas aestuarii TaxID=1897729 RepID=A0A1J0VDX2_9GAMM|nr:hypothetical protein [Halomonas aestuarii]APE30214.1 hypothetical protein BOX17_04165 [Halomonas aestuarii]